MTIHNLQRGKIHTQNEFVIELNTLLLMLLLLPFIHFIRFFFQMYAHRNAGLVQENQSAHMFMYTLYSVQNVSHETEKKHCAIFKNH